MAYALARTGAAQASQQSPYLLNREQKPPAFDPASLMPSPSMGGGGFDMPPVAPVPAPVPMPSAPAPVAPPPTVAAAAPPPAAGAAPAGAVPSQALSGLSSALRDPGPGFAPDAGLDLGQPNLGVRTGGQPLDILRQIVNQRGRLY